ncbi:MAG: DDE-type integrase/transposase/recombinase [Patescibacteria group bacterium]|nr:DDE-type integrase/transposase/recombinase [Patescibacteria group bacterium]
MSDEHEDDGQTAVALARYEIIGRYLALDPPRGQRRKVLEQLSAKTWRGPDGQPMHAAADTLRVWVRRYRTGGLDALKDKSRPRRGVGVLNAEQCELVSQLKQDVPERSLERIITIAEDMKLVEPGVLRRSTVHRVLQSRGLSARKARVPDAQDLDRFEAAFPNDLWQSDLLTGVWLPDPERAGKTRRADLFAFLDDHSRLLLHGQFSFRDNLPALELVFRRAIQKYGLARRVYYDNGQVYRSIHMRKIVAALGIHRIVFTRKRRPMGHGKIEALNRLINSAFLAEVKKSQIRTIDQLNEAFRAWTDLHYNRNVHGETGEAPIDRWRSNIAHVRYAEEELIRKAFLWKESRTPDKSGVFSLLGIHYQVGPKLARKRVQVFFDPEAMHQVEVWLHGEFRERVGPLQVSPWRRPKPREQPTASPAAQPTTPRVDYLGHLVRKHRDTVGTLESASPAADAVARRRGADQSIVDLLSERLDAAVVDEPAIRQYLERFGPFEPERATMTLQSLLNAGERKDQHIAVYLDAIRREQRGNDP